LRDVTKNRVMVRTREAGTGQRLVAGYAYGRSHRRRRWASLWLHRRLFHLLLWYTWTYGLEPAVDTVLAGGCFERLADHARDRPVPGGGDMLRL
jgi:hypothetical protein